MSENVPQFGDTEDALEQTEDYISPEAVWDDLKDEVSVVEENIKFYKVPRRPNLSVGFNCAIDYDEFKAYLKSAQEGPAKKKVLDPLRLAFIVLTNHSCGIRVNGRDLEHDGAATTLASPKFWRDAMKEANARDGMRKLFISEGDIISMSQTVMDEAGYGDIEFEEDNDELSPPR